MERKISNPQGLIEKAEREALASLKKSSTKRPKKNRFKKPSPYALKVSKFRDITGRLRVTREERRALHEYTPRQVANRKTTDTTAYLRRVLKLYREYEVPDNLQIPVAEALEYLPPKQVAKRLGLDPIVKEGPDKEWKTFTPVDIKTISYYDHPGYMKKGKVIRQPGGYYYENISTGFFENELSIETYFSDFSGGKIDYQGTKDPADALQLILDKIAPGVLVDPGNSGHCFLVYKDEWESATGLATDYYESRHYV